MEIMGKVIEKDNIITVSWHMPVSFEPELYAISIGKQRFSAEIISRSKAFVINLIPYTLKEAAIFCGTHTGKHIDKYSEAKLTMEEAKTIDCGRIKEASAYIECEVVDEVEAGDHIIYIGKVVEKEEKEHSKRLLQGGKDFTTSKY